MIASTDRWERPDGVTFERGDDVLIGDGRVAHRFIAHCRTRNGQEWVALYGGSKDPNGVNGFRYVDGAIIRHAPRRRSR